MSSIEPPWPLDEPARIAALRVRSILDTPAEPLFDRLVRLATRHFGTPIALVSLVDENRQWFKARVGLDVPSTSRRLSFCAYAILEDTVMVVPDATRDPRFADNDLVTGEPGIRFYAGAPLVTADGLRLGTLCVIDRRPRHDFDAEARRDLADFAHCAMHELDARAVHHASAERFRALVENTPVMMWLADADGTLQYSNAAWRAYTGQDKTEGNRWEFFHPDDRARIQDLRRPAIGAGEPYACEVRVRRSDGAWRWHLGRVVPLREDGRPIAWIGTAMDIHDLHRAREVAEEADRSKTRFLAAASHDLRQPMQSILLFAEALAPHLAGDETGQRKMRHLQHGLETLKGLLDGLLDLSRLDAGIVRPQVQEFAIGDLLDHLGASYAPVAAGKGLEWRVTACHHTVRSDRILLGRMLRNLIENAVRYTERGRIRIDCGDSGDRLRIRVRDTGIGIPADQTGAIFEEFHQVGNPGRDRSQGLGLGLAIVRRLSALLDHPVTVRSRPGRGTVFTVEVPLARRRDPAARTARTGPATVETATPRAFAVVVDDDAVVLMGLRTILQEWGYDVLTAMAAAPALKRLEESGRRPDVVLVDYRLRDGRVGTEAVEGIRARFGPEVPGIILTGEIGPEPQRDAAALQLGLLYKPVTPNLLKAALARHAAGGRTV
ncbi:hybrid sensor histidine kinase/response regulator [Azospirillum sp. ST 5-10]|uniref:hybrid sensor histidine kinase/response regulator n=1 Tax=unclassified Azospirillum TaxID=2630922 RepID=UPI003F49FC5C